MPLLLNMKEDRLALIKAVDSGDTDLGEWIPGSHQKIVNRAISLPCLAPLAQTPASGQLLPTSRRWGGASRSSHSSATSVREGAEPRDAERLLLL